MYAYHDFLNSSYNSTLITSIMEALTAENFSAQFIALTARNLDIRHIEGMIRAHHIRGLLVPEFDVLYAVSEELVKLPVPVIGIGNIASGLHRYVCSDSYRAGCDAANYLWSNGHRRFGVASMSRSDLCQQQRIAGFCDTIRELGSDPADIWHREFLTMEDSVSGAVSELVNLRRGITGLFSTNSLISQKLLAGFALAGLRVPEDISLLSFEENGELEYLPVPVSVLCQPTRDMGTHAVRMLIKLIRGVESRREREVLNCSLVIRKSVRSIPVHERKESE